MANLHAGPSEPERANIRVGDQRLAVATWGTGPVGIVMLHDGLGSIDQWRSVPAEVAARTDTKVLAYERAGHGTSTPVPAGRWPTEWLHSEAVVLEQLLTKLGVDRPLVVGHSDGGSAALIHAATARTRLQGVLAIAPHSWVEEICRRAIIAMRYDTDRIVAGLGRYHAAPSELFEAWSGVWVSDDFSSWDIRPMLATITAPTVIAQGIDDAYASDEQAILTAQAIGVNARYELLPGVGHIAHHDNPKAVIDLIVGVAQSL